MTQRELKEHIKELEKEVESESSVLSQKRKVLQDLKMELAEISTSNLVGKYFKHLVEREDDGFQEDYTEYIKILGLKNDRQVYIESFDLIEIKYRKKQKMFKFIVNGDIFIQFLDEFDYKEITEAEYKKSLEECLEKIGIIRE